MNALELKVPTVALVLATALVMWLATLAVPSFRVPAFARAAVSLILVAAGVFIALAAVASFRRARTTVNPMKPNSTFSLVTGGIYGVSRNPMYLGFLLVLLGWAAFLSNALAFLVVPAFVLYMNRFQITPEERSLSAKFDAEFSAYRAKVRRWL
jgi:protein-S-isoprenylcysteine O-methyltransferase Ste14